MSFLQDPPVVVYSAIKTFEGSSAISDGNGRLLFYSNGVTVFNSIHETMDNGDFLAGDLSSTSNSIIVKLPDNDSLYYLFTVGAANELVQDFCYSVININANNGLGKVIEKNTVIGSGIFEKLAAVRHCNKRDAWLIVKKWNSDLYYSYLLSPSGLDLTQVSSSSGFVVGGSEINSIGALKVSADGKMIAAADAGQMNILELMKFDNSTGQLSPAVIIKPNDATPSGGFRGVYSVEFSPNGKLLYVASNNSPLETSVIYQFDISSGTEAGIMATRHVVSKRDDWFAGGLQLGPDRKIYYCMWQDTALSVIENPDIYGHGCNFVPDKIRLPNKSESGLTNYVSSDLISEFAAYDFLISRSPDCTDRNVGFSINYTADIDSVKWEFGDGGTSTLFAPSHLYAGTGIYGIKLTVFRTDCTGAHPVTLSRDFNLQAGTTKLPADKTFCMGDSVVIRSASPADSYLWSTSAIADSIVVKEGGSYWLETQTAGCTTRDTIIISPKAVIRIQLGNDTTVCVERPIVLRTAVAGFNYLWNTGNTQPAITVTHPGSFWVRGEDNVNCIFSDTIAVTYGNCEIYFPSAFTPNGDGHNETFGLLRGIYAKKYELLVFNRWGSIIFRSNDLLKQWDGSDGSKPQPMGSYPWIMSYTNKQGLKQIVKGTVLLIR